MKLTTKTRYGMRAMSELAGVYPEGLLSVKKIAKRQEISDKYLEQIITPLREAGLIRGEPGARGGYHLTRAPEQITLYDIYIVLEGSTDLSSCLVAGDGCARKDVCLTKKIWREMSAALENALKKYSLVDLTKCEK